MIRRMFLLLALILALAATDLGIPTSRSEGLLATDVVAQETLLDLAWLAPVPTDLDTEGYGLTYGVYHTAASGGVSVYGNPEPLTAYDEAFSAGSPRQTYYQSMSLRSDDDPDIVARQVSIVLAEYGDDDDAETGFAAVVDVFATYEQTRTPPEVGDEAVAFRGDFTTTDGRAYQELRILVRTGRFLADLVIDDYTGDAPATSELTPLAELVVERLGDAAAAEGPGLGLQVTRLAGEDVTTFYDYYTRRGGDEVRAEGERTSLMQSDDEYFEEAGSTDHYYYVAEALPADEDPTVVSLIGDLRLFTDEESAGAHLETAVEDWTGAMATAYQDIEIVDDAEEFGDGSVAVSYVQDSPYGPLSGYRIWVQVGDRVAAVELDGDPAISLELAEHMAEAQLACLEDEGCLEPLALSESSQTGSEASQEDTPEAEADETPEATEEPGIDATAETSQDATLESTTEPTAEPTQEVVATETYVSPTYGFSLAYDPLVWTISEGPATEGNIDYIGFSTFGSDILFGGLPYSGDALSCAADLVAGMAAEPDVVSSEPLLENGVPVAGGDASDAFQAVVLTHTEEDLSTSEQAFYARCIELIPGTAMVGIQQWSTVMFYDVAAGQREELVAGLVLP